MRRGCTERDPELAVGDLVLVARLADKDKLKMVWRGPFQVTAMPSAYEATVVPFTFVSSILHIDVFLQC